MTKSSQVLMPFYLVLLASFAGYSPNLSARQLAEISSEQKDLMNAIARRKLTLVKELVADKKVDSNFAVEFAPNYYWSPLCFAVQKGTDEVFEFLLERSDPNFVIPGEGPRRAASCEIVSTRADLFFANPKLDPNDSFVDANSFSSGIAIPPALLDNLYYAVKLGSVEGVQSLLKNGANPLKVYGPNRFNLLYLNAIYFSGLKPTQATEQIRRLRILEILVEAGVKASDSNTELDSSTKVPVWFPRQFNLIKNSLQAAVIGTMDKNDGQLNEAQRLFVQKLLKAGAPQLHCKCVENSEGFRLYVDKDQNLNASIYGASFRSEAMCLEYGSTQNMCRW